MTSREFTIANEYVYNTSSTLRWLNSHIFRYPFLFILYLITMTAMVTSESLSAIMVGRAFDTVINNEGARALTIAALWVVATYIGYGLFDIINSQAIRILAQRVERDARDELYLSLLSKSQTFHGQQRVGDLMARATNDVQQIQLFVSPALGMAIESTLSLIIPIITIITLDLSLTLVPAVFLVGVTITLIRHNNKLSPVADQLRANFGVMNAGLAEAITGIEVVKGFAQESFEEKQFSTNAGAYRNAFVAEGGITAQYLPLLLYGMLVGVAFGHALFLFSQGVVTVGEVIAYMALLGKIRSPIRFLLRTSSFTQQSIASARRVLEMILTKTELDQNRDGVSQPIDGHILFENVDFSYEETAVSTNAPLTLQNISFSAQAGQTVAIVGQTGAGKSTLTKLLNRTFDTKNGRVLIDGIDVRDWNLDSLRSQIATIEQDIFLFSRTISENIAFGARDEVSQAQIEEAARMAQAHEFISQFPKGYDTVIGERGVMLSGGQRQRLAIARAFLSSPRILVLDDSTSAIDSNTEDQIQKAMQQILEGRTTLLITHRLSQIRQADHILLMKNGRLIAQGSHETLMERDNVYREIFSGG
ncbi:MAG: ABC transporter ATP-binding protein [Chloroflexota bacterium]